MFYQDEKLITYNDKGFIFFWDLNTYSYIKKSRILTGNLTENCDQDISNSIIFSIGKSGVIQSTNYENYEESKMFKSSKLFLFYSLI